MDHIPYHLFRKNVTFAPF